MDRKLGSLPIPAEGEAGAVFAPAPGQGSLHAGSSGSLATSQSDLHLYRRWALLTISHAVNNFSFLALFNIWGKKS